MQLNENKIILERKAKQKHLRLLKLNIIYPLIKNFEFNAYIQVVFFGICLNGDTFECRIGHRLVVQLVVVDRVVEPLRPLPLDVDRSGVEASRVQKLGRTRLVNVRVGQDRFGSRTSIPGEDALDPDLVRGVRI